MREEIQEVIDGHMSITDLIDKVSKSEENSLKKANIINELWNELDKINKHFAKSVEEKKASA